MQPSSPDQNSIQLPNSIQIQFVSKPDVSFLYKEIFEEQCYLQKGISLGPGDVVLDVGGNIGMFALFAAQAVKHQGQVISAEPIPDVFAALQRNVRSLSDWSAAQGLSVAQITPLNVGVSSGAASQATFTFYSAAAGWSSMYPDGREVADAMDVFLGNSMRELDGLDNSWRNQVGRWLQRFAPAWVFRRVSRLFVERMLNQAQTVTCQLKTVSQIIREQGLDRVDLLKVDVERAELHVFRGVDASHWPIIKQVACEVHDVGSNLQDVLQILKGAGFHCIVDQDAGLKGSTIYNVYAVR